MIFKFKIYTIATFFLLSTQISLAQDEKIELLSEKGIKNHKNNTVNSFIDSLYSDFFYNQDRKHLDLPMVKIQPEIKKENNSLKISELSNDRQLNIEASEKSDGAKLRILDKIYGISEELEVFDRKGITYGSVSIVLKSCFYQKKNILSDALASVVIRDKQRDKALFSGWISSTQSHLTFYDNYRYSVWLLSCMMSDQE